MANKIMVIKPTKNTNHSERITVGNNYYLLNYQYNIAQDTWQLGIYKRTTTGSTIQDTVAIVTNMTIITGLNLLYQFKYLGLGSLTFWSIDPANYDHPTSKDLNVNFFATWEYNV